MSKYIKLSLSVLSILLSGTSLTKASSQALFYLTESEKAEATRLAKNILSDLRQPDNVMTLSAMVINLNVSENMSKLIRAKIWSEKDAQDPTSAIFKFMPEKFKEAVLKSKNVSLQSTPVTPKKLSYDEQKARELLDELNRRVHSSTKSEESILKDLMSENPNVSINGQIKSFTPKQLDLARQLIESSSTSKTITTPIQSPKYRPIEEKKNLNVHKLALMKAPEPKLLELTEDEIAIAEFYIEEILSVHKSTPSMPKEAIFRNMIDNENVGLTGVQKSYVLQRLGGSTEHSSTTPTKAPAKVQEKKEKVVKKPISPDAELTVDFIKTIKSVPTPGGGNCGDLAVGMTRPTLLDGLQKVLKEGLPKGYNISQDTISKGIDNLLNKDDNSESIDSKILQLAAFGKDVLLRFIYEPTDEEKGYGMKRSEQDFMDFNTLFKIKPHLPILYVDVVEGGGHYQATSHFENMIETQEKMREAYLKTLPRLAQVQEDEMIKDAAAFYKKCNKTIEDCFPSNKR